MTINEPWCRFEDVARHLGSRNAVVDEGWRRDGADTADEPKRAPTANGGARR